ncbi:MAG: hypothetical protein IJU89_02930 [Alphaproteobacteria bacterium]|nr:hypothetical protein [Alphaproteobacteria bacterium]
MRKIFSAALALVCIWFATPAFANCNLFDPSAVPSSAFAVQGDGTVSNTITDTRTSFRIQTNITANGTNRALFYGDLETPGNYVKTFTIPEGTTSIIIKHNGTTKDIFLWSPNASVLAPGTYTLSFDILSSNPSVVGGLQLKNIQIERGSAATEYTPYNPLCATCDGTVVNYTSATGTGVQNGTPTPENPIEPTFYKQGNMILRKVGDYADSYDATTGKITRRVGVKVLDGSEAWRVYSANAYATNPYFSTTVTNLLVGGTPDTKLFCNMLTSGNIGSSTIYKVQYTGGGFFVQPSNDMLTVENFKSWLVQQYSAGTPVTIYYPLAEETTEDWPASYCETPIKIATTKYNESAFRPLNTALANAISVVDTVVSNTITQAGRIATLQAQKQTRPNDIADDSEKCPAGKKCLLVEDASGVPHWYEIVEQYSRLPEGFTELQYVSNAANTYLDTGIIPTVDNVVMEMKVKPSTGSWYIWQNRRSSNLYGISGSQNGDKISFNQANSQAITSNIVRTGNVLTVRVSAQNGIATLSVDDEVSNNSDTKTGTYEFVSQTLPLWMFGNQNGNRVDSGNAVYYAKMYMNDELVMDYIPAKRNSDGVVGFYDLVSRTFKSSSEGELTAGPEAQ